MATKGGLALGSSDLRADLPSLSIEAGKRSENVDGATVVEDGASRASRAARSPTEEMASAARFS